MHSGRIEESENLCITITLIVSNIHYELIEFGRLVLAWRLAHRSGELRAEGPLAAPHVGAEEESYQRLTLSAWFTRLSVSLWANPSPYRRRNPRRSRLAVRRALSGRPGGPRRGAHNAAARAVLPGVHSRVNNPVCNLSLLARRDT